MLQADTKGDVDLLEQSIKEAMGDLRGQIEDLQGGDARLTSSHIVTQGVHGFSRQGLESAH